MSEYEDARERAIIEQSRRLFDQSLRSLDGETRSRLAEARARAVEAAGSHPGPIRQLGRWIVPAGAMAAGALVLALIGQLPQTTPVGFVPAGIEQPSMISDLDILLEEESLDLFEELEFYAWLLEQPELADSDEATDGSG